MRFPTECDTFLILSTLPQKHLRMYIKIIQISIVIWSIENEILSQTPPMGVCQAIPAPEEIYTVCFMNRDIMLVGGLTVVSHHCTLSAAVC